MRAFRTLTVAGTLAALAVWTLPAEAAQAKKTYLLRSGRKTGDTDRVVAELVVGGELKEVVDEKVQQMKMGVKCSFSYDEKTLEVPGGSSRRSRSARYYDKLETVIKLDDAAIQPVLRPQRRLIGVEVDAPRVVLFSPEGALTRDELDLLGTPGSSLLLDQLLPEKPVAVGESWKHPEDLMVAMLGLDAVSRSSVLSVLEEVTDRVARMELSGRVDGAIDGVSTEIDLKARYRFDLKRKRIDWLGLLVNEKRSIGHVGRGVDAVARLEVKIVPKAGSDQLTDAALTDLSLEPTSELSRLSYASAGGDWRITHDRRWHVIGDHRDLTVMRWVDRGELIAQCNVSALPKLEPGKQLTLGEFQSDVQKALGESFDEFVEAGQRANEADYRVLRVVVRGEVSELPIQWSYYLVADRHGRQVAFTFTVEPRLAERFGEADAELIRSFRFLDPKLASTGSSQPDAKQKPPTSPPGKPAAL